VLEHPFPDHYRFRETDLRFDDENAIIMTEKDAVKCRYFCGADTWYLTVDVEIDRRFGDWLQQRLRSI
jgi:tetraacyldisaccharide 4'-kinase